MLTPRPNSSQPSTPSTPSSQPSTPSAPSSQPSPPSAPSSQSDDALPEGWEKRMATSGRPFYIDHNTRKTQWVRMHANNCRGTYNTSCDLICRVDQANRGQHQTSAAVCYLPSWDCHAPSHTLFQQYCCWACTSLQYWDHAHTADHSQRPAGDLGTNAGQSKGRESAMNFVKICCCY